MNHVQHWKKLSLENVMKLLQTLNVKSSYLNFKQLKMLFLFIKISFKSSLACHESILVTANQLYKNS